MKQVTDALLGRIVERLVGEFHPDKIVLFGSRAWGEPDENSDVDLLVVVPESDQPTYRRATRAYRSLRDIGVPVDVIVNTRHEVERSKDVTTSLIHKVFAQGKVLYGGSQTARNPAMANQGGS